ncbi:MAG: glycoside hydrolase family 99-like domain-containing protein [Fibromonadaceae bacterium]|jgi:lipopolysaccharide biosynthesis protein|nr:glycoside hydrolase family 99-like domain-containing protein [Fibromonadaceae bacterium]
MQKEYSSKHLRALAVVLPQFHPIPENDEWWGKGFTEWTNVAKAKPRFKEHYQPHIPADLGFYDLRLEESRIAQAELAKKYGIYGFCYYHYWFYGKQLLERPVNEIVVSGKPNFPFCLCWVNEPWGRNWNGLNNDIMQEQKYSKKDHLNHIRFLLNIFKDKRYIKVNEKPLFIVYRATHIPNVRDMISLWNTEAKKNGFKNGLYFLATTGHGFYEDPTLYGFEGVWDFLPYIFSNDTVSRVLKSSKDRISLYDDIVKRALETYPIPRPFRKYPGVCPGWDNSPRKAKDAFIVHDSTPDLYEKWLAHVCEKFEPYSKEENFVFLNAMNEWAEGNHLEPDLKWGLKYLEATKRVLDKYI